MTTRLLHEEKTYLLRGHIFAVRNELGAGWSEFIYQEALVNLLDTAGIPAQLQPRCMLRHRGVDIHLFVPDLVVWDAIVLELKVLPYQAGFASEHVAQLIHYLKFLGLNLGQLVDFAPAKVKMKRLLWQEPVMTVREDLSYIESLLTHGDRARIDSICSASHVIGEEFGLGYSDLIYKRLMEVELAAQGLTCRSGVVIPAHWRQEVLASHQTTCLLVDDDCLLLVTSLSGTPADYDFERMKTYLRSMCLRFGLLVNFGYRQLQLFGVSA